MSVIKNPKRFYVYEFYKADSGEVFYVGKGTGSRMYDRTHRNKYFLAVISKYNCKSRKVYDNLTSEEAINLEIKHIALRKSQQQAYCNMTDGGEGFPSGDKNPMSYRDVRGSNNPFYGKKHTEETKAKISKNRKGKGGRFGSDNPMYGKPGMTGKKNPMYGKTGFLHPNHRKIQALYKDGSIEYMTAKQAEKKFGIAFLRVSKTGGPLVYKKKTPNDIYAGTIITIIEPVTTIEK